jgi:hypothetical protein
LLPTANELKYQYNGPLFLHLFAEKMMEQAQPDLSQVIDFRFMEIEAELSVILDHLEALDRQLPTIQKSERDRLERGLEGLEHDEWYGTLQWIDEFVDEVLPRLFYSPVLVQLWAVFESGIIEISKYIRNKEGHLLSVDDLRGNSDYERAQKYYRDVLRFPLIEIEGAKERLDLLYQARNAIAHSNGRIEAIKAGKLEKLRKWEKERGGVLIGLHYVSFPIGFVKEIAHNVRAVLEDLIKRAKDKY